MTKLLTQFRAAIPAHCFTKSAWTSLAFMMFDLLFFGTCIWTYPKNGGLLPHLIYWNVYGFIGWCVFVVGHDCGHGTFSHSKLLNAVCGHICHGVLMVPFFPWARSHHQHHCYHNHKDKDRSYPWKTALEFEAFPNIMQFLLPTVVGPFIGYWTYLLFGHDGSHMIWFGELYRGASWWEKLKSMISSVVVLAWIYVVYVLTGSWAQFWLQYGGIIGVTYVWLFMVTWFQHHDENTLVYDDEHWTFAKGSLQTVDRTIGYGIDHIHHHITDCHIAHHMFFTTIPHYHLREATDAMYEWAEDNNVLGQLKRVDHSAYPLKFVVDFFQLYPKINILHWSYGK